VLARIEQIRAGVPVQGDLVGEDPVGAGAAPAPAEAESR
jgi:hypothetical protein